MASWYFLRKTTSVHLTLLLLLRMALVAGTSTSLAGVFAITVFGHVRLGGSTHSKEGAMLGATMLSTPCELRPCFGGGKYLDLVRDLFLHR